MATYLLPAGTLSFKILTASDKAQQDFEDSMEQFEEIEKPCPQFGLSDSPNHSIYSYTDWFYDGDEQAFSII
jgi:hypothetical protein